jgi:GNAT superfamily N-acetyltransferase
VYTVPPMRRRGVYRALFDYVQRMARGALAAALVHCASAPNPRIHVHRSASAGVCGIRLYAESHNSRAHATYRRCGMSETDYRIFEIDYVISRTQDGPA